MKHLIPFLCLGCLIFTHSHAQEVISEADAAEETSEGVDAVAPISEPNVLDEAVIPKAYDAARYQTTWSNNPFLRKTIVIDGPKVVWSNDWALAGMYKSTTGKISISLQNKQTGEFKRVTSDDGADSEFRLIEANFNRNRTEASVDIAKGSETATLKYDDALTSRPVTISNTFKTAAGGQPGNPNLRQGQPGQPVNATPLPGAQPNNPQGVANRPGGGINPAPVAGQQPSPASPPTISRRRQLIPAPVVPPAQPQ